MILWTFQPREVTEILEAGESFSCDPALAGWLNHSPHYSEAYQWLARTMAREIPSEESPQFPVWLWHTAHGEREKPNRRKYFFSGLSHDLLTLTIPDHKVMLSSFRKWCSLLDLQREITEAGGDEAFAVAEDWTLEELRDYRNSIFELEDAGFIQATTWTLEPQWLTEISRSRRS